MGGCPPSSSFPASSQPSPPAPVVVAAVVTTSPPRRVTLTFDSNLLFFAPLAFPPFLLTGPGTYAITQAEWLNALTVRITYTGVPAPTGLQYLATPPFLVGQPVPTPVAPFTIPLPYP